MWCKHQLGELARNQAAFDARGVGLLAISNDEVAPLRGFARQYDIGFPLLSDPDGKVAAQYTSIDGADIPVPAIVVIERGGEIRYEQQAMTKDDRPSIDELLAIVDRSLRIEGQQPGAARGFGALDRLHVAGAIGGGVLRDGGYSATAVGSLGVAYPAMRNILVGARVGGALRESPLDVDGSITLRIPFWRDTATVHLDVLAGWSPFASAQLNAGGRIGWWVALRPDWGLAIDGGVLARGDTLELTATFGVSRLLEVR